MIQPSKELVGASTSVVVLAALAREPSYGYQIVKTVNQNAEGIFTWSEGTIYPVLHKLEKDRLIRAQWQEAENGRERKYYYITAKGRSALSENIAHWTSFHALILGLTGATHG